ncbi:MAG TPA: hypothetical protein ENJ56_01280 [Anaerolineae bacterium]|nr:hypothetical protein [Anaerolineae bacterium]
MHRLHWLYLGGLIILLFFIPVQATSAQTPHPTVDRLAAPPTVPVPNQADEGAQLYWLYCQPCHGDQGQGLTDEWRAQYPEEEQNCWQSGCHGKFGKDAPENGFVLPTSVPALIGDGSLSKFTSMQQAYQYLRVAMPYELPGKLTDEEYLAIAAHIARERGVWDGHELNADNLAQIHLQPVVESLTVQPEQANNRINRIYWVGIGTIIMFVSIMWLFLRNRKRVR